MRLQEQKLATFGAILALTVVLLASCSSNNRTEQAANTATGDDSSVELPTTDIEIPESEISTRQANTIEFCGPDGAPAFKFVHSRSGSSGSAFDAKGRILLRFTDDRSVKTQKFVRIENNEDKLLGFIRVVGIYSINVEDEKKNLLYKLHFDNAGRYSLRDPQDRVIYRLLDASGNLKIQKGETGKTLFGTGIKGGKVELRSADGNIVLSSRPEVPALALTGFGMKELTKEQQFGLAYSLLFMRL